MKLPLFKAAFKDQRMSMWIYAGVMFAYGLLIMLAFLSVEQTLSDPFSEVNGLTITEVDEVSPGTSIFNLSWEIETGTAASIALGFDTNEGRDLMNFTFEDFEGMNSTFLKELLEMANNSTKIDEYLEENPFLKELFDEDMIDKMIEESRGVHYPLPLDGLIPEINLTGVEFIYFGEERFVEFMNSGNSDFFIVGLIPQDWNLSRMKVLGPVTSSELVQMSDLDKYLEDNPMMDIFLGDEVVAFTEVDGFMALEYFSMWPLMLLIFMAIKTGGAVSKHVDDQSIDILLATGYSRFRFLNEKMLVMAVNLVVVLVAAWIGIVLGVLAIGEPVPLLGITYAFLGSIPMAIGIVGISLLLSVLIDENSKTTGAILGVTIFMFMIQIVSRIADWGDGLGYISIFRYYFMVELMVDHVFDPVNVIVPTVVGIITIVASYILFKKKEIHA